jgi:hypothetical protein
MLKGETFLLASRTGSTCVCKDDPEAIVHGYLSAPVLDWGWIGLFIMGERGWSFCSCVYGNKFVTVASYLFFPLVLWVACKEEAE